MHAASIWRLLRFTRLLRDFYFYEINAGSLSSRLLFSAPSTARQVSNPRLKTKAPSRKVNQKILYVSCVLMETSRLSIF